MVFQSYLLSSIPSLVSTAKLLKDHCFQRLTEILSLSWHSLEWPLLATYPAFKWSGGKIRLSCSLIQGNHVIHIWDDLSRDICQHEWSATLGHCLVTTNHGHLPGLLPVDHPTLPLCASEWNYKIKILVAVEFTIQWAPGIPPSVHH